MPKLIKEQFPSGTLSSFEKDVTAATSAGPAQTNMMTLSELADSIESAPAGSIVNVSHSVPNPLGNVTSFAATIRQINEELRRNPAAGKKYLLDLETSDPIRAAKYREWLGLCALVALRNVYSMNGVRVELVCEQFKDEPFDRAVYFSLKNMDYRYRWMASGPDIASGGMYYLRVNDQYVALYNLEVGLCPMQQYQTSAWEDRIPWFDRSRSSDHHQCWNNPFEVLDGNTYVLDRLAAWLMSNNGDAVVSVLYHSDTQAKLTNCITPDWLAIQNQLELEITNHVPSDKKAAVANAPSNFCAGYAAYCNHLGTPCPMPNLLTDSLFLADVSDGGSCGLGYPVRGVDWSTSWKSLRLSSALNQLDTSVVVPTLPFTEEGCKALECGYGDGDFELVDASFLANGDAGKPLKDILAEITIRFTQTGEMFTFERRYVPEKIRIGLIPYLGVWPNAKMPVDAGWSCFIATQAPSHADSFMDKLAQSEKWQGTKTARIELALNGGTEMQVCEMGVNPTDPDRANCQWKVTYSTTPFRFATTSFVYQKDGKVVKQPCGAVFVRRNEELPQSFKVNYKLAIDFGTTSSVCAVQNPEGTVESLPFRDYLQNVTVGSLKTEILPVEESRLLGTAPRENSDVNGKTLLHQKKVMSVAQLFANHTEQMRPYVDGRFFLANSAILCRYIDGNNFAARGIYNELKLTQSTDQDVLHATAGYLAGLYIHALLYIMEKGGRIEKLNLSYPDKSYQLELSSRWEKAGEIVNSCLSEDSPHRMDLQDRPPKFWTEADAANNYFNQSNAVGATPNIVVDIGGGTADISLTNTDRAASVQFAGRELMVNSIIEAYRHWHGNEQLRKSSFEKMWGDPLGTGSEEAKPKLIMEFHARCDHLAVKAPSLQGAMNDQTLRMLTEVLLNDYEMDVKNGYEYSLFRSIITFKFSLLMSLVAQFVLDNRDKIEQEENLTMGMDGYVYPINIRFVGTAAKTLEHVFAESLDKIDGVDSEHDPVVAEIAKQLKEATGSSFRVKLLVSDNVQEKTEVAFGMLADAHDISTPSSDLPDFSNSMDLSDLMADEQNESDSGTNENVEYMEQRVCEIMWYFMKPLDFTNRRTFYRKIFGAWPEIDPSMNTDENWKAVLQKASHKIANVPENLKKYYAILDNAWQEDAVNKSINDFTKAAGKSVPEEIDLLLDNAVNLCLAAVKYGGIPKRIDLGAGEDAIKISDIMPDALNDSLAGIAGLSRKNLLTNSLGLIKGNKNNMKSLANQKNPEMRKKLLGVYLAVSMLNDALSQRQI